jgi:exodeoxyribonuclease VII large subunit
VTEEPTYGVAELGGALDRALRDAFGQVWVRGEVAGLRRPGHVYFDLVEQGAKVPVVLFAGTARVVDRVLAHAGLELGDGVELRIRAAPGYHAPFGRLQLTMSAVDPAFTVGQLALARERLLRDLHADGTVGRNAALPVPALPLRIGVVTSAGSAAWNDVRHQLEAAGCGFVVVVADARVQGEDAPESILEALRGLWRLQQRAPLDLVAIVRGGGSRTDLAAFDDERIARAIAQMPVPVWTGIGHEIDTSVADAVAHTAFPTPTAVAAALRGLAEQAVSAGGDRRTRLRAATAALLDAQADRLAERRSRLQRAQGAVLAVHAERLRARRHRLAREAVAVLESADGLQAGLAARLPAGARRVVDAEAQRLAAARRQVDALDPARVLGRGFSITRKADGRVLRAAAEAAPGEVLVTTVASGTVRSRVEEG